METNQQEPIKRSEFLRSLGLSSAALMAFYCMGTLTSCSKGSDDPDPTPTPTGKVDFTIDLNSSTYADLKDATKKFVYKDDVLIAQIKTGDYIALSKICTHEGNLVTYRPTVDNFYCPNHGSVFDTTGKVTVPAVANQASLKKYSTTLTGTSLRVFEA
ncbi:MULTISPECIES: QcrA and Rieske domain-containing protein [Larkinella]|uniref:Rieske (2Fe-2S) protein n=1 Tax=Larkinella punicea TaxID=2315727 RepID=A0A368JDL2_9BACT|nr:Rieske (2Fe-2S) protein [Larkinella punicea]RCR65622.1 Rieske (2Fe-2S) protein [Larkinella punicea]